MGNLGEFHAAGRAVARPRVTDASEYRTAFPTIAKKSVLDLPPKGLVQSAAAHPGAVDNDAEKINRAGRKKDYDCIIGLSGGIDSTYTAYAVKQIVRSG